MKEFKREDRYLVLKRKDIEKALNQEERQVLYLLSDKVACHRTFEGISFLKCVVIEHDWPEYEPTWKAIEARTALAHLRED